MKDITEIRLENLKDAEYIIVVLYTNCGHVWNDIHRQTFTEMLDIMLTTNDIDDAAEMLDVPVYTSWTVTEEFQVDEKGEQDEPMMIMRVK